ncbi:MAG: SPFH domain-containing protein [Planctomycetota bacterium]|nr:SPFH domain-containing protein [Planctomycetota bacterium]
MRIAKSFLILVAVCAVGLGAFGALFEKVPPSAIGVKQALWGGGGVVEKDHHLGYHLGVSGYHKWYLLDKRTHFLNFSERPARSRTGDYRPSLQIRTKDNNVATFDVTVTYRIIEGEGYKIVMEGNRDTYRSRVADRVESTLREELAQLSSEEIYDTTKRIARVEAALVPMTKDMQQYHVQPERILVRAIRFPAGYEKELQEKQITYQKRELAKAERGVEEQQAINGTKNAEIAAAEKTKRGEWDKRLETMRADNKVAIATVLAEAEVYHQRTQAEGEADYQTAVADGQLAVDKAEALRNELRNQALDTTGGRIFLAQKAATNLTFESVTLNSNDPAIPSIIDVNGMVELLIGEQDDDDGD